MNIESNPHLSLSTSFEIINTSQVLDLGTLQIMQRVCKTWLRVLQNENLWHQVGQLRGLCFNSKNVRGKQAQLKDFLVLRSKAIDSFRLFISKEIMEPSLRTEINKLLAAKDAQETLILHRFAINVTNFHAWACANFRLNHPLFCGYSSIEALQLFLSSYQSQFDPFEAYNLAARSSRFRLV